MEATQQRDVDVDVDKLAKTLFITEQVLLARPVLQALRESPAVPLVDGVERADDVDATLRTPARRQTSCPSPACGWRLRSTPRPYAT